AAVRAIKQSVSIPVVVNGDVTSVAEAQAALARSGADAVMVGRGARGRPWFPGALARTLATGRAEPPPSLARQCELATALYHDILAHYGTAVGVRHARKHPGWALDVAAAQAGAPTALLKQARGEVLTVNDPPTVVRRFTDAFDLFSTRLAA